MTTPRRVAVVVVSVVLVAGGACSDDDATGSAVSTSTTTTGLTPSTSSPNGTNHRPATDGEALAGRLSPLVEGRSVVDDNAIFGLCADDERIRIDLEPVIVSADELAEESFEARGTPIPDLGVAVAEDFVSDGTWIRVVKLDGTWLKIATATCT